MRTISKINLALALLLSANCLVWAQNDTKVKTQSTPEKFSNSDFHKAYVPTYKNDAKSGKVKNVILLIGDGMGLGQITGGLYANKNELSICNMLTVGFCKTYSADDTTTDSAASGTALATGNKTYNGAIGVDINKEPLANTTEILHKKGMATGVLTTDKISGATPSSFYAHQPKRNMQNEILSDLPKSKLDFFSGGNKEIAEGANFDLIGQLKDAGFTLIDEIDDIDDHANATRIGVLPKGKEYVSCKEGREEMLKEQTQEAIKFLNSKKKGFFLMVEGAQIDFGSHQNDTEFAVREVLDFDKAVAEALRFADEDGQTLVIVTADHETGGLGVTGGNIKEGEVKARFIGSSHTAAMVPIFSYGPQSNKFRGVMENTDVQKRILEVLK